MPLVHGLSLLSCVINVHNWMVLSCSICTQEVGKKTESEIAIHFDHKADFIYPISKLLDTSEHHSRLFSSQGHNHSLMVRFSIS